MKRSVMILLLLCAASLLPAGCGQSGGKADSKTGDAQAAKPKPAYGKIKEVKLAATIDPALVQKGGKIFNVICTACHRLDTRYVGPALGKVTERRTPEYIMNMILDTETMLEKDDTVKCLLQQYLTKMPNTNVNEQDARTVLEFLRDAGKK
jgi:cytochrome c